MRARTGRMAENVRRPGSVVGESEQRPLALGAVRCGEKTGARLGRPSPSPSASASASAPATLAPAWLVRITYSSPSSTSPATPPLHLVRRAGRPKPRRPPPPAADPAQPRARPKAQPRAIDPSRASPSARGIRGVRIRAASARAPADPSTVLRVTLLDRCSIPMTPRPRLLLLLLILPTPLPPPRPRSTLHPLAPRRGWRMSHIYITAGRAERRWADPTAACRGVAVRRLCPSNASPRPSLVLFLAGLEGLCTCTGTRPEPPLPTLIFTHRADRFLLPSPPSLPPPFPPPPLPVPRPRPRAGG
ncbi:hypothetical protein BC628DRAFT_156869 [Trametes gibbosa]|nr:hypothetical protein BC628DRAFT_156869 [Trametes gibbosa]